MRKQNYIDYIGKTYGRLTVISFNEPRNYGKSKVYDAVCLCNCGNKHTSEFRSIKRGSVKSCGCLRKEITSKQASTHGLSSKNGIKTKEYETWRNIKERCLNANNKNYKHYGGRGITICDEWINSFETFYKDMGLRPSSKHSIERKDVDKGYSKENCIWILKTEQPKNTTIAKRIVYQDQELSIPDLCKKLNIPLYKLRYRMNKNKMSLEEAINNLKTELDEEQCY